MSVRFQAGEVFTPGGRAPRGPVHGASEVGGGFHYYTGSCNNVVGIRLGGDRHGVDVGEGSRADGVADRGHGFGSVPGGGQGIQPGVSRGGGPAGTAGGDGADAGGRGGCAAGGGQAGGAVRGPFLGGRGGSGGRVVRRAARDRARCSREELPEVVRRVVTVDGGAGVVE